MPLYLWPKGADLSGIKAAVENAGLPFKVKPFWFSSGDHQKCIVLGSERPPVGPDYVMPKSEKTAIAAVRWFFGLEELPVVHTAMSRLESIFGEGVVEEDSIFNVTGTGWSWPE